MKPFTVVEPYTAKNGTQCYISLLVSWYDEPQKFLVAEYHARLHFCGYVIVKSKRLFNKLCRLYSANDLNSLACHGGVTYCESFYDKGNAIGFDCCHGEDNLDKCNKDYVKEQLELLSESLDTFKDNL